MTLNATSLLLKPPRSGLVQRPLPYAVLAWLPGSRQLSSMETTHRRTRSRTPGDPSKVIGYVRVSTGDQALGPEAQRSALLAWCEAHDCTLVAVFFDQAVGGAAPADQRPGLSAALAGVKHHGAGTSCWWPHAIDWRATRSSLRWWNSAPSNLARRFERSTGAGTLTPPKDCSCAASSTRSPSTNGSRSKRAPRPPWQSSDRGASRSAANRPTAGASVATASTSSRSRASKPPSRWPKSCAGLGCRYAESGAVSRSAATRRAGIRKRSQASHGVWGGCAEARPARAAAVAVTGTRQTT